MARRRSNLNRRPFEEMIGEFCNVRFVSLIDKKDAQRLRVYMVGLVTRRAGVPRVNGILDWNAIAEASGLNERLIPALRKAVASGFEAIARWQLTEKPPTRTRAVKAGRKARAAGPMPKKQRISANAQVGPRGNGAGRKKKPVEEFPTALWEIGIDPPLFADALQMQMQMLRHADTTWHFRRCGCERRGRFQCKTIQTWIRGTRSQRSVESLAVLARIERRYRLAPGYFQAKFPNPARSATGFHAAAKIGRAEKRRLAWHLPEDFNSLAPEKQTEIIEWIRRNIVSGSTDFRRYQSTMGRHRYAITFGKSNRRGKRHGAGERPEDEEIDERCADPELLSGIAEAPPALQREMEDLVGFKTSTLTAIGFKRNGVWAADTAFQRVDHLGLLFGALAASPLGEVKGLGLSLNQLTFGLLAFPGVWDWYVQWRERRRGFYTRWEVDMLSLALSLVRSGTGWLRQHPELIDRVKPIEGLISQPEIEQALREWDVFCDRFNEYALSRQKEIDRVARVHRDPFEPILRVLEAASPLAEYRKITEEILRQMPDPALFPLSAAETTRAFLLIRLGLHLGVRQKNLRELLVCQRGQVPTNERRLEDMRRGELRWSEREGGWEVLIPSAAFKNSHSSFFADKPFRLKLPDLQGLYGHIDTYMARDRDVLLAGADDPGTFFVKTVKSTSKGAAYDLNSFYNVWRLTIQRYGVFNPYTGRGAIEGILPHGPHSVRDVLDTHILKQTGS